jgi:flagellar motility protein MotE (MotC chaperone)
MAEYGEWNRKGASLSDVTAKKEYGVDREFIIKGINAGKLEFREGSIYGNPYIKVLRRQLEEYIAEELGKEYLNKAKNRTELRKIKKEIAEVECRLASLKLEKTALERLLEKEGEMKRALRQWCLDKEIVRPGLPGRLRA